MSHIHPARYENRAQLRQYTAAAAIQGNQGLYQSQGPRPISELPLKTEADRKYAPFTKKVQKEIVHIDEDARSSTPSRHHNASVRSSSVNAGQSRNDAPSARNEPQDRSARAYQAEEGAPENSVRPSQRGQPVDENRSGRAASSRNKSADPVKKEQSERNVVYDLQHRKIGKISKDGQPLVVIDKDGVSRCGTIFEKVSDSQISHPENLVCDNCCNKKQHEEKKQAHVDERERDKNFINKVNDDAKRQLAEERERQLDKARMFQDAIEAQRNDNANRKDAEKAKNAVENEKIKQQMANRDDEIARFEKEREKMHNFINDIRDQIEEKKAKNAFKDAKAKEDEKKLHNLIIDDGWRGPHREAMKEAYKNALIDHLNEREEVKNANRNQAREDDQDYRDKLADIHAQEGQKKRDMDEAKRKIFMDEIQKQLDDKDKARRANADVKQMEDENYRKKLDHDRQVDLDNAQKKRQMFDEYLNKLDKQIVDKDMEKRIAALEAKKRYNTTLCLGKKPTKCYNCAVCKSIYPLKMLNKKHRVA